MIEEYEFIEYEYETDDFLIAPHSSPPTEPTHLDLLLSGHTALITGAASGIGLATARLFAQEQCCLVLWDLSPNVVQVASELAQQFGVETIGTAIDIVDEQAVSQAFDELATSGHSVDHVVHCAATGSHKFGFPFTNLTPSDWKRTLEINVMGMVNVTHAIAPTSCSAAVVRLFFLHR